MSPMNSFLIYALAVLPGKHETFRFVNIYPTLSNIMVQHPSEYLMVHICSLSIGQAVQKSSDLAAPRKMEKNTHTTQLLLHKMSKMTPTFCLYSTGSWG
jgi:hypothetical protein